MENIECVGLGLWGLIVKDWSCGKFEVCGIGTVGVDCGEFGLWRIGTVENLNYGGFGVLWIWSVKI